MSIEQRQFSRTPMSEETIYFSKDSHEQENDRVHYFGTITNISMGGLGLRVNFAHEPEEELWFEGIEGYTGARVAKVRWRKDTDNQESFEIGVQF